MATGSIHFIPQRDKGKSLPTLSPRRLRPLKPPEVSAIANALVQLAMAEPQAFLHPSNCHAGFDPASPFSFLIMYIFH